MEVGVGGRGRGRGRHLEVASQSGGDFAGDPQVIHGVDAVRGDVEVEDDIGAVTPLRLDHHAGARQHLGELLDGVGQVDVTGEPVGGEIHALHRELAQEAQVVFVEDADIGKSEAQRRDAVDTHAEGEPLPFLRVVTDGAQDVGVDHAAAEHLDPAVAGVGVQLRRRFGEGEIAGPQAGDGLRTEQRLGEVIEGSL